MSNEFSNLAWVKGDIPRDREGIYFVYLDKKILGRRFATCCVRKTMNSFMVTIDSYFEWDQGVKILAWVSTDGLEPLGMEELINDTER